MQEVTCALRRASEALQNAILYGRDALSTSCASDALTYEHNTGRHISSLLKQLPDLGFRLSCSQRLFSGGVTPPISHTCASEGDAHL